MSAFQTNPHASVSLDEKHLNLLSLCHYIAGALLALFGTCPLIYLVIGVVLVAGVVPVEETAPKQRYETMSGSDDLKTRSSADPSQQQNLSTMPPEYRTPPAGQSQPPARNSSAERNAQIAAGAVFIVIAVIMVAVMWAIAIAIIVAGVNLRKRKAYTFCIVMGAIECIFMPLGTILGVFTLVVLNRPGVKALFENPSAAADAGPMPEPVPSDVKQWP